MVGLENTEQCVFFSWAGLVTFLVNNESKCNCELCCSHIRIKTQAQAIKLNQFYSPTFYKMVEDL